MKERRLSGLVAQKIARPACLPGWQHQKSENRRVASSIQNSYLTELLLGSSTSTVLHVHARVIDFDL
jgi:hypothetical protein